MAITDIEDHITIFAPEYAVTSGVIRNVIPTGIMPKKGDKVDVMAYTGNTITKRKTAHVIELGNDSYTVRIIMAVQMELEL